LTIVILMMLAKLFLPRDLAENLLPYLLAPPTSSSTSSR
jgi:uncharacterized membrane protein